MKLALFCFSMLKKHKKYGLHLNSAIIEHKFPMFSAYATLKTRARWHKHLLFRLMEKLIQVRDEIYSLVLSEDSFGWTRWQ